MFVNSFHIVILLVLLLLFFCFYPILEGIKNIITTITFEVVHEYIFSLNQSVYYVFILCVSLLKPKWSLPVDVFSSFGSLLDDW